MNKRLQELKYDLERVTEDKKAHCLIAKYTQQWIEKQLKVNRAIGESDECNCVKCSTFEFKALDDKKNKDCEGKKLFGDYNERNREALNSLYGVLPQQTITIADARKVLCDAFTEDPDFKHSYMANIRMFFNDRADVLIDEEIIYDMLDYILREEG